MSEAAEVAALETPAAVTEDQNTAPPENSESGTESTVAETTKPEQPTETEEQKRSKYQRRIDRKNAEIAAARTEARIFKERLEQLEAQRNPQQQRDTSAPTLDKFDNFEDYMAARVAFEAEKVVESRLSKAQQQEAQRRAAEAHQSVMVTWQDKQASAMDKYADFKEVVEDSDAPTTPQMSQAIVESDVGAELLYYLAQHPDEAKAIARLSPTRQIAEIGKLEVKIFTPAIPKPSETPPPVNPVGVKAKAERNPDDMPVKDWLKWRNEQLKAR